MKPRSRWLFVLGPPRTGTTPICRLLSLHPDCLVPSETHWLFNLFDGTWPGFETQSSHYHLRWEEDEKQRRVLWSLPRILKHTGRMKLIRQMALGVRRACGNPKVFGDKSVSHAHRWEELRQAFPNCSIIVCDREAEEIGRSIKRTRWGGATDPAVTSKHAAGARGRYRHVPDACRFEFGSSPRYYLRGNVLEIMERACAYAGLEWATYPQDQARALVEGPPVS